jgi:SAM-dependent methyltransferase
MNALNAGATHGVPAESPSLAPTLRFSDRVEDYVRHRPSYPAALIDSLREHAGLGPSSVVADVGSGTGIFAQLLLPHCARVFGVEPNAAMRAAGERLLAGWPNFARIAGTAESTGLPDASVDLITAAQAFHWFDAPACRREFSRIVRPGSPVALVWNERLVEATPFLAEYESMLRRRAIDYGKVNHTNVGAAALGAFFGPGGCTTAEFSIEQLFDFAGLRGRLLSSSYAPNIGHPGHEALMGELASLFERHAREGHVSFHYASRLLVGRLS